MDSKLLSKNKTEPESKNANNVETAHDFNSMFAGLGGKIQ